MPYVQTTLTPDQNKLLKHVNDFRSIEYNQLAKMFPKWTPDDLRYHTQRLYNSRLIDLKEGSVIVSYAYTDVDHNMLDCLWVALEDFNDIKKGMLFRAESPVSLIAQYNDGTFREFVKLDQTTIDNLFLIEERHFTRTIETATDKEIEYVLICDTQNMLKSIEEYGFKAPYTTALLQFDENGNPEITGTFKNKLCIDA
jgi:hypothetical protein